MRRRRVEGGWWTAIAAAYETVGAREMGIVMALMGGSTAVSTGNA
jgi:hypothetical protein